MGVLLGGRFRFVLGPLWGDAQLSLIRRCLVTRMRHFLLLPVAVALLPCGMFAPTSRASVDSASRSSAARRAGLRARTPGSTDFHAHSFGR